MSLKGKPKNPEPAFPDHARHITRDMVLLALDALSKLDEARVLLAKAAKGGAA